MRVGGWMVDGGRAIGGAAAAASGGGKAASGGGGGIGKYMNAKAFKH